MAEEKVWNKGNEYGLEDNYNYMDPIVILDRTYENSVIVAPALDYETSNGAIPGPHNEQSELKTRGVIYPLIKLPYTLLSSYNINYFKLYYSGFLPKLYLVVNDYDETIRFRDYPSINSIITVVMIPSDDGKYKKISLDFKITSFQINDAQIIYWADGYMKPLEDSTYMGVSKFSGYSNADLNINLEACTKCNTWELFYTIAKETRLGFQSLTNMWNVNDRRPRLLRTRPYKDVIADALKCAGAENGQKTPENIFDAWVDLWGTLTLVNVKWLFDLDVNPNQIGIVASAGAEVYGSNTGHRTLVPVQRVLVYSNNINAASNMEIQYFEKITDINGIKKNGGMITEYTKSSVNTGGTGGINTMDCMIASDDHQSNIDEALVKKIQYSGEEGSNYQVLGQSTFNKTFFTKIRAKTLKVKLKYINFGLQRGTLVGVFIEENRMMQKKIIIDSAKRSQQLNASSDDESIFYSDKNDSSTKTEHEIISDSVTSLLDSNNSGIFYIDAMEFVYENNTNFASDSKIVQYLYLIKTSNWIGYANKYIM